VRVLVAGIGGIGGLVASTLARGGADVSLLARGAGLEALRNTGLRVLYADSEALFKLPVFASVPADGKFDAIFACCKAQDFPQMAALLKPAIGKNTAMIACVNGMPWWFLDGVRHNGLPVALHSLDPQGVGQAALKNVTPVGVVVHASAHGAGPGVVRIAKADRLIFGDPPGHTSVHTKRLSALCEAGGVAAPAVENIREEIWAKLWGNQNMNPVSALTRLTASPILEMSGLRKIVLDMMQEFERVGEVIGLKLPMGAQERIEVTKVLGDFRTSMLNDAEAGRRLEHEAILGSFVELAQQCGVGVPVSEMIYALLQGLDLALARKRAQ